jgi:hypothetical protein
MVSGFLLLMLTIMLTPTTFADQTSEIITANENFQLVKIEIPMNISSDNVLPWGAVYGTIKDHVNGYPVIIQIYKNGEPVHFAQTDVSDDGSYEYKFRIKSVNDDVVINVFEGNYDVKIFQTIKSNTGFSI